MRDEILAQGGRAWFYRADVSVAEQAKAREEFLSRQPMHRLLTPGEVADAILYLARDSALSVTGFNLVLDGGMSM